MPIYSRFSVCIYLPLQSNLLSALNSVKTYSYLTDFTCGVEKRDISQKIHSDSNRNNFSNKENGQSFSILLLILPKNVQLCKIRAFELLIIGLLSKHSSRSKDNKLITLKKFQEIKMNENKN